VLFATCSGTLAREVPDLLLYHDAADRRRSRISHNGALDNSERDFKDVTLGRGKFRVFHQKKDEQGISYGPSDEESRLNVNHASAEELAKLPGLTPETAAAIIDYRDPDNEVTQSGAEQDEYAAVTPPYRPHNAPFRTTREILMVLGLSQEDFLGEDLNQNGLLDPEEDDGQETEPNDNADGRLDAGWSGHVTVHSEVPNENAAGDPRVNVQDADESSLAEVPGLTRQLAQAMVRYRGQNRFESLADLLQVTASTGNNRPPNSPPPGPSRNPRPPSQPNPNSEGNRPGEKLISEDLLIEIADDLTAQSEPIQKGAININTADPEVLACLPGITEEIAHAIVSYRTSNGFFANVAWLLKVPGINAQIFKQVEPRVCTRSHTFRILSEGKVTSTGASKRIQAIVRISDFYVDTLSIREDNL